MLKEMAHFLGNGPEMMRLQRSLDRAEFAQEIVARADLAGFAEHRRALVGDLTGKVLDVGCGTGGCFRFYGSSAEVEAIEPADDFRRLASANAAAFSRVRVAAGDAMSLGFADESFDAVVFSTVLCSVPSVERAIAEAYRVLRPGGALRVMEHVRSDGLIAGPLMSLFNPLWLRLNKQGCNMNRRPLPFIERSNMAIEHVETFQIFSSGPPAFQFQRIHARKRA
jgi:ubiquinone/menaquinone biosynthesis C-methylase UbiE